MAYFKPPKPMKIEREEAAGLPSARNRDLFRCNVIVPMGPLETKFDPNAGWNPPGHKLHSDIIDLKIGLPFDNSKPRKGLWGATQGTTLAYLAQDFVEEWEMMKIPKAKRDAIAATEAKDDLLKRIEQCLLGNKPGTVKDLQETC